MACDLFARWLVDRLPAGSSTYAQERKTLRSRRKPQGAPAAKSREQLLHRRLGNRLRRRPAHHRRGDAHLARVLRAMPTHAEVELEPDPIQEREPPLHVVGDELGHLLAAQHHLPSCRYISSSARRTRVRARWSTTRWFDSVSWSALQTSRESRPSRSRRVSTARCVADIARSSRPRHSSASRRSSTASALRSRHSRGGSLQLPRASKRAASTSPPSSFSTDPKGVLRASRTAIALARLRQMRTIQVRSDERPSKRGRFSRTRARVSFGVSSAVG